MNQLYLLNSPWNFYSTMLYKGNDDYNNFKLNAKQLLNDIKIVEKNGIFLQKFQIHILCKIFWTGDGKFRRMLLGRSSAKSTYCCTWCSIQYKELGKIDKKWNINNYSQPLNEKIK